MNIKDIINHQNLGIASLAFIIVGIFASPVVMSIGMIGLALNTLTNYRIKEIWYIFKKSPALYLASLYFVLLLLSGLYSDNMDWLFNRLFLKLPFLAIPFTILSIPRFDKIVYHRILYGFSILVLLSAIVVSFRFLLNFDVISESYKNGTVMDTPVMHIRYSLMVAYSFIILTYLSIEGWHAMYQWEKYIQLMGATFLFGFIHFLAVRSGMVALYSSIGFVLVMIIFKKKLYLKGLIGISLLVGIAWLGITKIPSLHNKLHYTIFSIYEIKNNNDIARLSDSYRLASIKAGIEIGNSSPLIGVGLGDVKQKTTAYVEQYYPELAGSIYTPQNQYVLAYSSLGLIGLILFLLFSTIPLYYGIKYIDINIVGFHIIAITSFIVEQTLESQVGIAFYFTFSMMGILFYIRSKKIHISNADSE